MTAELDLFGLAIEPAVRRYGRRPHDPTEQQRDQVRRLRASGMSIGAVAAIIGISATALARHYSAHLGHHVRAGHSGRPRHAPTDEQRQIVRDFRQAGATLAAIASAVGVSVSTLRVHYREELEADA